MTETYIKDAGQALNTVFQLYKAKINQLPKKAETDAEKDKVADWFGKTLNEFVNLADQITDEDVKNFASHFCSACLLDIEDKYKGKQHITQFKWLGKTDNIDNFISSCEKGDCVKYKGVVIEVRNVD